MKIHPSLNQDQDQGQPSQPWQLEEDISTHNTGCPTPSIHTDGHLFGQRMSWRETSSVQIMDHSTRIPVLNHSQSRLV
jgi:hypothetical protein